MTKDMPDDEIIKILDSIICDQTPSSLDGQYRYSCGSYKLDTRGGVVKLINILTNAQAVIVKAT